MTEEIEYGSGGEHDMLATARFEVSLHRGDGEVEYLPGPEPLDEALAWARARADVVIVRTLEFERVDTQYSAGERAAQGLGETQPWPSGGLTLEPRRLPGREFVDRTEADPVISWDVHVSGHLLIDADAAAVERFLNALRTADKDAVLDARVGDEEVPPEDVDGPWTTYQPLGSGPIDAIVRVRARTSQRAELRAIEIVAAAPGVIRAVKSHRGSTFDPCTADAAPTGSPYAPTLR